MAIIRVKPGVVTAQDGTYPELRGARKGGLVSQDVGGSFEEACYRGAMFAGGMQLTSVANATFTTADGLSATLGTAATSTPILGIWNPATSNVNAVILQVVASQIITAATSTGTGPLVWVGYLGQTGSITTALNPINRKSFLSPGGSQVKNVAGVALTGLQNIGTFLCASGLSTDSTNFSFVGTAAGAMTWTGSSVENIDGSIIVPPGGILALYASTTPVAISIASSLLWEEIPL